MANEVKIQKKVYDKGEYDKVIDRRFKTYAQPEQIEVEMTVEEFFTHYENLYYEIKPEGETNSHQYLIQKSSELVDFKKDTQDIQPLLDEIAQLRAQVLEYQVQLIEANTPKL